MFYMALYYEVSLAATGSAVAGLELEDVTSDNRLYKSRIKSTRSLSSPLLPSDGGNSGL